MYIEQVYEGKIKTLAFDRADSDAEVESAINQAIDAGCNLIFTTATQMVNQSVRSAILHPKVKIYNCSIKMSYSSICTYYARMYESKFLMGAIAAALKAIFNDSGETAPGEISRLSSVDLVSSGFCTSST